MRGVKAFVILLLSITFISHPIAQEVRLSSKKGGITLGMGAGLPYGAAGMRISYNVVNRLSIFGGVGYHFAGLGYNVGLSTIFKSKYATQFYFTGMYGTNAAIVVSGLDEYDNVYTGPSLGGGVKLNSKKKLGNFWDIALIFPIRSQSFKNDQEAVSNDFRVIDFTEAFPVTISIGFNFNLVKKTN